LYLSAVTVSGSQQMSAMLTSLPLRVWQVLYDSNPGSDR